MGWVVERRTKAGAVRFYAYARDTRGAKSYVGVFGSEAEAIIAWRTREVAYGKGEIDDVTKRGMTFERYVREKFLPTWRPGEKRRRDMTYTIEKRFIPHFGAMKIGSVTRETLRAYLIGLVDEGLSVSTVRSYRTDLAVIFNRAADDGYCTVSPTFRLKLHLREKPTRIHPPTPDDIAKIRQALPGPFTRLLVDVMVSTGMRWGEVSELRGKDVAARGGTGFVQIERAVSDVGMSAAGTRFVVNAMTKGVDDRKVVLADVLYDRLIDHINAVGVTEDTLVFPRWVLVRELIETMDGREKKRHPRPAINNTQHISSDFFRKGVWYPTLDALGMKRWVPHELRHAYGTWALANGANIVDVKEDYGHKQLETTQRYVHAVQELRFGPAGAVHRAWDAAVEAESKDRVPRVVAPALDPEACRPLACEVPWARTPCGQCAGCRSVAAGE